MINSKIKSLVRHILKYFCSRLDLSSSAGYFSSTRDECDPFVVKATLLCNEQVKIIFDVGAHKGLITARYRELFPQAKIFAFEPYLKSFEDLKANFAADPLILPHSMAISSNNGKCKLNINSSVLTNSLLETDTKGPSSWKEGLLETVETTEVDVITLDKFCSDNQISFIDLLKLDIQGNELSALQGAKKLLLEQRINLIYCEVILVPTYREQFLLSEILEFTQSFDYKLFGIYNNCYKKLRLNQIDIILVNLKTYNAYEDLLLE
jgi:FkbM family methyltransferase